jgi:hypothetical protein
MITATELLAAPRGRSLCLAVAERLDDAVGPAVFAAAQSPAPRRIADLIGVLRTVDPRPIRSWTVDDFADPVDYTISFSMAWQEPDESDAVSSFPAVVAALYPIAESILAAPSTDWWDTPVELSTLRCTSRYDEDHPPVAPDPVDARQAQEWLDRWRREELIEDERARRERRDDPADNVSGTWWSTPNGELSRLTTTRCLRSTVGDGVGSVRLIWEEDSFGEEDALIWPMAAIGTPRIYEIGGPTDWAELVGRYPLEVSWSRRQDWYRSTGRDGRWQIPDYVAVARDFDAVHLTVAGYLTTAIRAVEVDADIATVLAGWDPDQTWWLRSGLVANGRSEHWRSVEEPGRPIVWRRLPTDEVS